MKIAMFGHKRIPSREGGVEIVVEELSSRMAELGHEVTCYNRSGHHVSGAKFDTDTGKSYRGIRLRRVPAPAGKGLGAVVSSFCAAVCCCFSGAQVVHIHAEGPAFMCWLPKLFGKRVIVTIHGLDWKRSKWNGSFAAHYIRMGERMAVRFADEIIVLSRHCQDYFQRTYHRQTVWIPNGTQRPEIREAASICDEFGLKPEGFLLFLGRLVPEKRVHSLILAYQKVKTDKKLVIAGGPSGSSDYVKALKSMAGDDRRIIFTGFVQGRILEELYSNAYIYVLPSDLEGMPLSLLEAMSYGNCCLVSDIPECMEVVEDKAFCFRRGDTQDLEKQLQMLCDEKELVYKMRKPVRDYICEKYNWDDAVRGTLELYQ